MGSVNVSSLRHYDVSVPGRYTLRADVNGSSISAEFLVEAHHIPTASALATVEVVAGRAARTVEFLGGRVRYGDVFALAAVSNGDGEPVYSVVGGPGTVAGNGLVPSAVGTVRVRAEYPETPGFEAGAAEADVLVDPRPIGLSIADQDFDFDGTAKTATYSTTDTNAATAGMIDFAGLTRGPDVGIYLVSVRATGNYSGSATATLRILPVIDRAEAAAPPPPTISAFTVASSFQWPAQPFIEWQAFDTRAVRILDENNGVVGTGAQGAQHLGRLDARARPYTFTLEALPLDGAAFFSQRGGSTARLSGPNGLNVEVTSLSTLSIQASGTYTYIVSGGGLSRSATFNYSAPAAVTRIAQTAITPATVTATWPDRNLNGPYVISASDLPAWRTHTNEPVISLPQPLSWTRSDDGAAGTMVPSDTLLPGTNTVVARFAPPSGNYAPATTAATWRVTVPVTVIAANATLSIDGIEIASGTTRHVLPGTTLLFEAKPAANHDWGNDWSAAPTIWTGSSAIIANPTSPAFSTRVPAGTDALTLSASAYQVGPRITGFTPMAADYTVPQGIASGKSYPRCWSNARGWNAFLGRDGVPLKVTGQSREAGILRFEVEARPPGKDWQVIAQGSPDTTIPNGARIEVPQTFSLRLGENHPTKPLLPADSSLTGEWFFRARVQDSAGIWSDWSPVQTITAVYPVRTVQVTGKTLEPLQDREWYSASNDAHFGITVLVP